MKKFLAISLCLFAVSAQAAYTPPGGISGQIQYNDAGSFGALNDIYAVDAYGAVCDGAIFNGVETTSGSKIITLLPSVDGYSNYQFTQADVGKNIVINAGQFNTPNPSGNYFTSTIASVTSSSVAVLSTNATFTSTSYAYATARMYKTDNKTAIQAALNNAAVNGGNIVFPAGVCATSGPLTLYSSEKISGSGPQGSVVMRGKTRRQARSE